MHATWATLIWEKKSDIPGSLARTEYRDECLPNIALEFAPNVAMKIMPKTVLNITLIIKAADGEYRKNQGTSPQVSLPRNMKVQHVLPEG